MDLQQLKGLILSFLQHVDEEFASQALLALGHGQCSANADLREHLQDREAEVRKLTQRLQDAESHIEKLQQAQLQAQAQAHPQAQSQAQPQGFEWDRRRADQAEADCQRLQQRLNELEDEAERHRLRANAYASRLVDDFQIMHEESRQHLSRSNDFNHRANHVATLLSDYGDEERLQ